MGCTLKIGGGRAWQQAAWGIKENSPARRGLRHTGEKKKIWPKAIKESKKPFSFSNLL
jgi:hypothetical protein